MWLFCAFIVISFLNAAIFIVLLINTIFEIKVNFRTSGKSIKPFWVLTKIVIT